MEAIVVSQHHWSGRGKARTWRLCNKGTKISYHAFSQKIAFRSLEQDILVAAGQWGSAACARQFLQIL